jgi:predicted transcriptional regulator
MRSKSRTLTGQELEIMKIVWRLPSATVRDVYEALLEQRKIAYTTVMTVMNNLVKKNLLAQDRASIAYVYTPAIPGREVAFTVLDSVVQRLLYDKPNVAISHLLDLPTDLTPEQCGEMCLWARRHFSA